MRIHKSIVITIVLAVVAAAGWAFLKKDESIFVTEHVHKDIYYCPMHPNVISDKPGACPICQMKLVKKENTSQSTQSMPVSAGTSEKKILYWTDLMIPGYKSDKPGKSPMGMDLIPVYDQSQKSTSPSVSEYATVSINTQQQQLMGIKIATVNKRTLTKTIHAYGYVAHDLELYDAQLEYIDAWHAFYPFLSRRTVAGEFRQDWRQYYMKSSTENRWRSDEVVKAQQRLIKAEAELIHMGLNETEMQQLREIKYGQPWVQPNLIFFDKNYPIFVYAEIPENDLGFISPSQKIVAQIPVYGETTPGFIQIGRAHV